MLLLFGVAKIILLLARYENGVCKIGVEVCVDKTELVAFELSIAEKTC